MKYPSRFNFFQEEAEEDKDLDETLDEIESEKDKDEYDEDEIDTSNFGSDTSDVQNEYDPKEVETLNNLIAAENDAMNDYFEAGKNAKTDVLGRLYADIGAEERFHAEQLIYAKCVITGEKYEPRDPKVKKEYEELLELGMDEDTAASTAIDKSSMTNDDGDDSDTEKLEQEAAIVETMLLQNEIITEFCQGYSHKERNDAIDVFVEAYMELQFFQEDMGNIASAPKEVKNIQNPLTLLMKGLRVSVKGLLKMSSIIRDTITKSKYKNFRKHQWIKQHGIGALFQKGIHLYLYNDKMSTVDTEEPARYVDLLYRLTKKVGENCGIRLTQNAQHKTIRNPIKFSSISEGLNILKKTVLTKTKVVVNDKNKDMLAREFFGYSNEKISVAVKHGDSNSVHDSSNIYSRLEILMIITKEYCKISDEVLERLIQFQGDVNSIYYKNRQEFNNAQKAMDVIVSKYNEFIKAMAHDLKVILSLDNGLLKMTRERDMTEQSGGKWEGEDIRTSSGSANVNNDNKNTKTTSPKRIPNKW